MKYNESKFLAQFMWIIYILIGLFVFNYVKKEENNLPVIDENEIILPVEEKATYKVIGNLDITTKEDIKNNKRSYIYEVEVFDNLTASQYEKISQEVISAVKNIINSSSNEISLKKVQINFLINNKVIYNYIFEN